MQIILYDEGISEALDIGHIGRYLKQKVDNTEVELKGSPFPPALSPDDVRDFARRIAAIRIQDIRQQLQVDEVEYVFAAGRGRRTRQVHSRGTLYRQARRSR